MIPNTYKNDDKYYSDYKNDERFYRGYKASFKNDIGTQEEQKKADIINAQFLAALKESLKKD